MPKLSFMFIQCEGPTAVATLQEALAAAFPAGVPTGPGVATIEVEEPTEIEPADEPTDVELDGSEPEEPQPAKQVPRAVLMHRGSLAALEASRKTYVTEIDKYTEPAPAKPAPPATTPLRTTAAPKPARPKPQPKPRRGKIEAGRVRAVEYLRKHGAATRSELARQCGIAHGSIGLAFNDHRFTSNERGLLILADHAAKEPAPAAKTLHTIGTGLMIDRGALAYARDAVYAELSLHDHPRTLRQIVRDTHLREGLVVEALKHKTIRETDRGFEVVPKK